MTTWSGLAPRIALLTERTPLARGMTAAARPRHRWATIQARILVLVAVVCVGGAGVGFTATAALASLSARTADLASLQRDVAGPVSSLREPRPRRRGS